jgi:hypothetical protein
MITCLLKRVLGPLVALRNRETTFTDDAESLLLFGHDFKAHCPSA